MNQQNIDIRQLLPTGTLLQNGKYRVVRYLSSGNFGNTYIVENTGMQVQFAMKEFFLRNVCYRTNQGQSVSVSPAVSPDKVAIQRDKFKKEARRLYGLTSKHLVHVNDMFEENGTVYYVMDFVKGESLEAYMLRTRQSLSEQQALYILDQLMDGLDEIHQKQIWHLDLKPANIIIDTQGTVVIIDFGASKQVGQSGQYTGTSGILCYTPGYAPLEQVNQHMDAVGPWTDIYALGATLYNLLTGVDPSTVNPAMLPFPPQVSQTTRQLICRMMSTDAKQRPQSIAELRQLVAAGSRHSAPGGAASSRRRWMVIAAAVAAVVAVIVLAVALRSGSEPTANAAPTATEAAPNTPGASQQASVSTGTPQSSSASQTVTIAALKSVLGQYSYIGQVDADRLPHGRGEACFTDGRYYRGGFVHGTFEGDDAFFSYPNGDTFKGTFRNNAFHHGRYYFKSDNTYFEGPFKDGQPDYDRGKTGQQTNN